MDRLGPVLLISAVMVGVFALLWTGWQGRKRRQSGLMGGLAAIPALGDPIARFEGQYVSTTTEGDWLDRVVVHGLGLRTRAELELHPQGVLFRRSGAPHLFIPVAALREVRTEAGMAGKFVERDGLVLFTWQPDNAEQQRSGQSQVALDTGFRLRHGSDRAPLLAACQKLIGTVNDPSVELTTQTETTMRMTHGTTCVPGEESEK